MGYEAYFAQPWHEGAGGLLHLEHVNVRVPSHAPVKQFYYDILGCGPDERRAQNIVRGSGTLWANIGTSQIHLPEGDPEVVPGVIGLVYPDVEQPLSRLKQEGLDALEGTKFEWKQGDDESVHVTCPYGNIYRIHKRTSASESSPIGPGQITSEPTLDPRGGQLPSPPSLGLGIAYVHFRVKPGTAAGIGQFYREMFGAEVRDIISQECWATGAEGMEGVGVAPAGSGVLVRVGPAQHIGFLEESEPLPEYDGHHICVYLSDEDFRRSFEEAERRGIVFVNPRRNFGKADTLEKALDERQYRIKDLLDPATGERLHELEHEIRSVSHPSYPVGRDVSGK